MIRAELWYTCIDDDMLDSICYQHYGKSIFATEIVLKHDNNRHLAKLGTHYPSGTRVFLPVIQSVDLKEKRPLIRIFD